MRHVYIPLGFEDKLGEEAILKFKDGRAILREIFFQTRRVQFYKLPSIRFIFLNWHD